MAVEKSADGELQFKNPEKLLVVVLASTVIVQGCASTPERNPVPKELYTQAKIPGVPRARFWGDEPPPFLKDVLAMSQADLEANHSGVIGREHNYLAVSGGGGRRAEPRAL